MDRLFFIERHGIAAVQEILRDLHKLFKSKENMIEEVLYKGNE